MDLGQMGAWLTEYGTRDITRVETLPYYNAASDAGDFERFLRGEQPTVDKSGWLGMLRRDSTASPRRTWRRVRFLHNPLSSYELYSCNCGYPDNVAAGEIVKVLHVTEESRLDALVGDFFVADNRHVMLTHYGDDGRHIGGEVVHGREAAALIAVRDLVWDQAADFTTWWNSRQDLHRSLVRAA